MKIREVIIDFWYTEYSFPQLMIISICFAFIFLGVFILVVLLYPQNSSSVSSISLSNNLTIQNCDNYTQLDEAVYCYRNYLLKTYKYIPRENIVRSLEDIELNGGDCFSYTRLYDMILRNRGFKTKIIDLFPEDDGSGHAYLIVYDKNLTGYCNIDMMNIDCFTFIKNESIKDGEL